MTHLRHFSLLFSLSSSYFYLALGSVVLPVITQCLGVKWGSPGINHSRAQRAGGGASKTQAGPDLSLEQPLTDFRCLTSPKLVL